MRRAIAATTCLVLSLAGRAVAEEPPDDRPAWSRITIESPSDVRQRNVSVRRSGRYSGVPLPVVAPSSPTLGETEDAYIHRQHGRHIDRFSSLDPVPPLPPSAAFHSGRSHVLAPPDRGALQWLTPPNEDDQYVRTEYGKHIDGSNEAPPTPREHKRRRDPVVFAKDLPSPMVVLAQLSH